MKNKLNSRLMRLYLCLAIPLLAAVAVANMLGFGVLYSQAEQISAMGLDRYAQQAGEELQELQEHLATFCTLESDINNMQYLGSEAERMLASKRVLDRMKTDVGIYSGIRAEFLYSTYLDTWLIARENGITYNNSQRVNAMVADVCHNIASQSKAFFPGRWQAVVHDDQTYALYYFSYDDANMGVFIDAQRLMDVPIPDSVPCTVQLLQDGEVITQYSCNSGALADSATQLSSAIGNTGFVLRVYTQQPVLQKSLSPLLIIFMLLPFVVALTLIALYSFTNRKIVKPIKQIVNGMEQAGDGDLAVRVETGGMIDELGVIGETLNDTLQKIAVLQKKEQKAVQEKEKSLLRNLQLQINPHFLGNCFNMIYNASMCGDDAQILALTTHLSRYFRSMTQMEKDFIFLEEELNFTNDFLEIQKLRFPDQFDYRVYAPEFLKQVLVPPSVIKSFAENAVQYSRMTNANILIEVNVTLMDDGEAPLVCITVEDNGPGFSKSVMQKLESEETLYFDGRAHIGIVNARKRLEILYGNRASLNITNRPEGGAQILIQIPLYGDGGHTDVSGTDC